jgi:hypothetical protein
MEYNIISSSANIINLIFKAICICTITLKRVKRSTQNREPSTKDCVNFYSQTVEENVTIPIKFCPDDPDSIEDCIQLSSQSKNTIVTAQVSGVFIYKDNEIPVIVGDKIIINIWTPKIAYRFYVMFWAIQFAIMFGVVPFVVILIYKNI